MEKVTPDTSIKGNRLDARPRLQFGRMITRSKGTDRLARVCHRHHSVTNEHWRIQGKLGERSQRSRCVYAPSDRTTSPMIMLDFAPKRRVGYYDPQLLLLTARDSKSHAFRFIIRLPPRGQPPWTTQIREPRSAICCSLPLRSLKAVGSTREIRKYPGIHHS